MQLSWAIRIVKRKGKAVIVLLAFPFYKLTTLITAGY
jgi:hypothetical protein